MHAGTRTKGAIVTAYIYIYYIYTQKHNVLPRSCRRRWTVKKYCSSHSLTNTLKYLISSHLHLIDKTHKRAAAAAAAVQYYLSILRELKEYDPKITQCALCTTPTTAMVSTRPTTTQHTTHTHNHNSLHTRARACVYICGACVRVRVYMHVH
jgi:hypothetical protein